MCTAPSINLDRAAPPLPPTQPPAPGAADLFAPGFDPNDLVPTLLAALTIGAAGPATGPDLMDLPEEVARPPLPGEGVPTVARSRPTRELGLVPGAPHRLVPRLPTAAASPRLGNPFQRRFL